jgi:hypothetical protein
MVKEPNHFFWQDKDLQIYWGINPLSAFAGLKLNNDFAISFMMYMPVFTNFEYGFSLNTGVFLKSAHQIESIVTFGPADQFIWLTQLHLGYQIYPVDLICHLPLINKKLAAKREQNNFLKNHPNTHKFYDPLRKGLYIGAFAKYMDLYNYYTTTHYMSIIPYITLGYWLELGRIFIDIRVNQTLAALSWSTLNHSQAAFSYFFSPLPSFLLVVPYVSFHIGFSLGVK